MSNKHIKVLLIVPARKGSKGVKFKNMFKVNGHPLIKYTFDLLKKMEFDYCITTDDDEIIKYAESQSLEIYFKRPSILGEDTTKMIDVIKHALNEMEKIKKTEYSHILLLQPTAPIRKVSDIKKSINLIKTSDADSIISVNKVDSHHPVLMKKIVNGYLVPFFINETEGTRRQDYKPFAYMRNGAIYLTKREIIIDHSSIWGEKIKPYIMSQNDSISIDNILDMYTLESYLKNK